MSPFVMCNCFFRPRFNVSTFASRFISLPLETEGGEQSDGKAAPVETKILFLTVTMPRFILLLITAMLGFAVGLLTAFGFKWKRSVAATAS